MCRPHEVTTEAQLLVSYESAASNPVKHMQEKVMQMVSHRKRVFSERIKNTKSHSVDNIVGEAVANNWDPEDIQDRIQIFPIRCDVPLSGPPQKGSERSGKAEVDHDLTFTEAGKPDIMIARKGQNQIDGRFR